MANISSADAQIAFESLQNDSVSACVQEFFAFQRENYFMDLLSAVRNTQRDTMREAQIAGRIDAYETAYKELVAFCKQHMRQEQPVG